MLPGFPVGTTTFISSPSFSEPFSTISQYADTRDLIEMNRESSTVGLLARDNTRYFSNGGEADIRGLELTATWRPDTTTWLSVQHTELRIDGPTLSPAESLNRLSNWVQYTAPRHSTALFGAWEFTPGWQLSLTKRWVGSMSWYQDDVLSVRQR